MLACLNRSIRNLRPLDPVPVPTHTIKIRLNMSLIRAVAATRARLSSAAAGSIIRLSRPVASVGSSSPVSSVCAAVRRPLSMRSGPATPHSQPPPADTTPYTTREDGAFGSNAWRMHLNANGKDLSFWHDIPLLAPGSSHTQLLFHYVNEIPKGYVYIDAGWV